MMLNLKPAIAEGLHNRAINILRNTNDASPPTTINLDANANAPTTPEVQDAILNALRSDAGNPSSGHTLGESARVLLTRARDNVASLINGAVDDGVIFTSGCTEANNTILRSFRNIGTTTLIVSAVEHSSVLKPAEAIRADGARVLILPVDHNGLIDLNQLETLLRQKSGEIIVSIQGANSETGVLQPTTEIAALTSRFENVLFHCDAAQSFGKTNVSVGAPAGPDVLSLSGHKIHAPMGVGAIVLSSDERRVRPLILGGGQERGLRSGTQSVPLIAGLSAAAETRHANIEADIKTMTCLRDRLENGVCTALPETIINGGGAPRLPNTSNMRFRGIDAIAMLANLDAFGIVCSQGSACSSGRPEPSHVLTAMGLTEEEAFSSVRFSVSPLNTEQQIDAATKIISKVARNLQAGQ